jgi:hypothetical protein
MTCLRALGKVNPRSLMAFDPRLGKVQQNITRNCIEQGIIIITTVIENLIIL